MRLAAGTLASPYPEGSGLTDARRAVACTTAVLFLGAAVLHISAAADHENLPVMMVGFLCVAAAQAGFGALLLWRRPARLLLLAGVGLTLGALATWLVSRTAGLPFLPGGHMEPIGFKDGVTVLFELGSLPGLLLLFSSELGRVVLPSARLGSGAVASVSTAVFALFVPAFILGGGGHHSAEQLAAMGGHAHGDAAELTSADTHGHADGAATEQGEHAAAGHSPSGSGAADEHGSMSAAHDGGGHGDALLPASGHDDGGGGGGTGDHGSGGHDDGEDDGPHRGGEHGGGGDRHAPAEEHPGGNEHAGGEQPGGNEHAGGGHGDEPSGGDDQSGMPGPDNPGGLWWGQHNLDYEPARPASDDDPGSGYAFVYRGPADQGQGTVGHHSDEPCQPTPEQQAAADQLYRETDTQMRAYDNNPGRAAADGFTYAFPLTDRIIHMVAPSRVRDETILQAGEIESFLYVMTDRGLTAVGGMYVMPDPNVPGPQIGGCLTRWHEHAGTAGRLTTAGTMERTPEMLHVWTYPRLQPYGHYDGRALSQLWGPGSVVPSLCRESGDSSDACLP